MKIAFTHIYTYTCNSLLLVSVLLLLLLPACNPTNRVPTGEYLLTHNAIIYRSQSPKKNILSASEQKIVNQLSIPPEIAPAQLIPYIKQKTNTKILGLFPLHLYIYNLADSAKAEYDKVKRNQRIDTVYKKKNQKRIAEGKDSIPQSVIDAKKAKKNFGEWLMSVGEPPVILDYNLLNKSQRQLTLFLQSKGYFKCRVADSVSLKKKTAKVFYIIYPGKPYTIDTIRYTCNDSAVLRAIYSDSGNCLIKKGENFDQDIFIKERDRIAHHLNDEGYYKFSSQYVYFNVDSTIGGRRMNITIGISDYGSKDTSKRKRDSIVFVPHPKFYVHKIIVQMQYNPANPLYYADDTTVVDDYTIVYPKGEMGYHPNKIVNKIFIRQGQLYNVSDVDYTYTGLAQLKSFRYIGIKFVSAGDNLLDCYIQLMPSVRNSLGLEAVGTNTGGDLGVQGDILYENKNLLKGAEVFQFKIKGGLEAQRIGILNENTGLNNVVSLNTIDIGPELDLAIPRPWFPFNLGANIDSMHIWKHHHFGLWPKANPQTVFKLTYDYQDRPTYYTRHIFGLAYTFNYDPYGKRNLNRWHLEIKLPEINYVHANLFPTFQKDLISTNNFFLLNSFTNHFVPDIGVAVTYNDQEVSKPKEDVNYFKLSTEESGYLLRAFSPVLQGQAPQFYNPAANQSYSISGVPYSYYVKFDGDYRHYFVLSKDDKFVIRFLGGIGVPMAGVPQELPFDKSYWGGGSNDIRAWNARALGPGGYNQAYVIDQIGDIKLEANQEYRFNVISFFNLALFLDEGNIWLLNPNPDILHGDFNWSGPYGFLNESAIGGGIGFRFDFTYFVFRFDLGIPIKDPSRSLNDQWINNHTFTIQRTALQIGIGYPF